MGGLRTSQYPEGAAVEVRYPRSKAEEQGDRAAWPWLPGTIEEVCGPDEWLVAVESHDVATAEDGSPAPTDDDDADVWFPMCFRDSTELRAVSE